MLDPVAWSTGRGGEAATTPFSAARIRGGPRDGGDTFREGFPGVAYGDSDNPASPFGWVAATRATGAQNGEFGALWTWVSSPCALFRPDSDRFTGPFMARTANPVLVVGNRYDPATPYSGTKALHDLMPNSSLLTVDTWGHVSLRNTCADATTQRYVLALQTPAPGTVCEPSVEPLAELPDDGHEH